MNIIRRLFAQRESVTTRRFNAYYASLVKQGSGYPTADEARKDLISFDKTVSFYGWPR